MLPPSNRAQHISIRVRTDSKMKQLINLALSSLRDQPDMPIVLHSFPLPSSTSTDAPSTSTTTPTVTSNAVDALPKLVSVAEVIKREYVRFLVETSSPPTSTSTKGKEKATNEDEPNRTAPIGTSKREGLHQYSILTTFESLGFEPLPKQKDPKVIVAEEQAELERQELIQMEWLTGKAGNNKRPKAKHTPCMVVVLSTATIERIGSDFTYQPPTRFPKQVKSNNKRQTTEEGIVRDAEGKGTKKRRRRKGGKKAVVEEAVEGKENNQVQEEGREGVAEMVVESTAGEGVGATGGGD
ncbi:uncharacterized protein JCM6883_006123 [Sporobolomyces salmoneus]|uniref:uncharacterized protein n=1 Tax=Sporobolomyces salmoneus TaxID=183962 RepID=UPI00317BAC25